LLLLAGVLPTVVCEHRMHVDQQYRNFRYIEETRIAQAQGRCAGSNLRGLCQELAIHPDFHERSELSSIALVWKATSGVAVVISTSNVTWVPIRFSRHSLGITPNASS
jgi:hypothetical protein